MPVRMDYSLAASHDHDRRQPAAGDQLMTEDLGRAGEVEKALRDRAWFKLTTGRCRYRLSHVDDRRPTPANVTLPRGRQRYSPAYMRQQFRALIISSTRARRSRTSFMMSQKAMT